MSLAIYQRTLSSTELSPRSPEVAGETGAGEIRQRGDASATGQEGVDTAAKAPQDRVELSQEARQLQELVTRDREVRAHEAAHAAVGGALAGSPSYSFETGPDGKRYAVGGAVSINLQSKSGDPQATLKLAEKVQAAALAPADPSATDLRIAAKTAAMAAAARAELMQQAGGQVDASTDSPMAAPEQENKSAGQVISRISTYA